MQDVGNLLKNRREEKNITLEQAGRETNIAPRYLEALETGQYDIFPGEPYIVGFLRNYSEYLGLNPEECIKYYKNVQIQETEIPTNILVPKRGFKIPRIVSIILITTVVIGGLAFIITRFLGHDSHEEKPSKPAAVEQQTEVIKENPKYILSDKEFEKRLFVGDMLILPLGEKKYELKVLKTAPELHLEAPSGTQIIELGESVMLDIDNDTVADMNITVEDLDKNATDKGVLVAITTDVVDQLSASKNNDATVTEEKSDSTESAKYKVLFESGSAYPVTLKAVFRTYCLFRYEQDHTNRLERYYKKSEQLTIQANNGIRIWASNGNAVKMQIIAGGKTIDIKVGKPGKVIVKDLKWIRSKETRRYKFVMMDVD